MKKMKPLWISMFLAAVLCGCANGPEQNAPKQDAAENKTTTDRVETSGEKNVPDNGAVSEEDKSTGELATQKEGTLKELLDSWDFAYKAVLLEQVTEALNNNGIHYTGYYNVSGERVDVTLEDGTTLLFFETKDPEAEYWEHSERYQLMMKGEELNKFDFQENYLNEYDVTVDEYIWPNLSEPELDLEMLWRCNQTDLSIARNQLFAKYGRRFTDSFFDALFSQKNWYEPKTDGSIFDSQYQDMLTETEKNNLAAVLEREEELYFRKSGAYDTAKALLSGSWLDLNGDGVQEQIIYEIIKKDSEGYQTTAEITLRDDNGGKITVQKEAYSLYPRPYLCPAGEGTYWLAVADNGMSADYSTEFYTYENGKLFSLGTVYTYPDCLQFMDGKLSGLVETWHLQCEPIRFTYMRKGGGLQWQEKDYYEYRGNEATALMKLDAYAQKEDKEPSAVLEEGERVKILGGDLSEWVKLERLSDGGTCWIRVKEGDCYLPDGSAQPSSLVFDGLTFYG